MSQRSVCSFRATSEQLGADTKSHNPLSRALPHAVVRRRRLPPDTRRGRRLAERLLSGDGGLVCPHLPTNRAYIALPLAHTMAMHAWPHDTCHGLHAWPCHMSEHALGEHATWAPVMPCHGLYKVMTYARPHTLM